MPPDAQERLFNACRAGCVVGVAEALSTGANLTDREAGGYTPLLVAVVHRRVAAAALLLARGSDATSRNEGPGRTALHLAAAAGNPAKFCGRREPCKRVAMTG